MQIGLVAAGRVNGSFLARLPRLHARLGPVVAQSNRLASRIVNTLGAGQPAQNCSALARARLVLVCVPPAAVPRVAEQMAACPLDWAGKSVLLCQCECDSAALAPVAARGAGAASLDPIPGLDGKWFMAEGDKRAVREAHRLVHELGAAVIDVDRERLGLYHAALSFASSLFTPLVEASERCLRGAGLPPRTAVRLTGALIQQSLRAYLHAGRKSWTGPLSRGGEAALAREAGALRHVDPRLADYYRHAAQLALALYGRARP